MRIVNPILSDYPVSTVNPISSDYLISTVNPILSDYLVNIGNPILPGDPESIMWYYFHYLYLLQYVKWIYDNTYTLWN